MKYPLTKYQTIATMNHMKNPTTTVLPNPAPATRSAGRPSVVLTAQTWTTVTQSLASQSDLVTLSAVASVSVPTMRKLLAEKFGSRIQFERGRRGGVTLVAQRKGRKS